MNVVLGVVLEPSEGAHKTTPNQIKVAIAVESKADASSFPLAQHPPALRQRCRKPICAGGSATEQRRLLLSGGATR